MIDIQLLEYPIDIQNCINLAANSSAGAMDVFIGTVRDNTQARRVVRLEYEAYAPMAISEMRKIAERACEKWHIRGIVLHHRIGVLEIGDAAVVIAVSTPHRAEAFEACKWVIDSLKQTVPIWKKEIFEDGEIWVAAHP